MKAKIRDTLNSQEKPWEKMGSRRWQLANGALDAIDDANTAIWTYFELDWPKGPGSQLLSIYGLFQATVIQQDGVIELCAAKDNQSYKHLRPRIDAAEPVLATNRDLRDRLVGHPANKSQKTDAATAGTFNRGNSDRTKLSAALYTIENGTFQSKEIDVHWLVEEQSVALMRVLMPVVDWATNPR